MNSPIGEPINQQEVDMFTYRSITLHNRTKYEIIYEKGGKHVAYLSDEHEAKTLVRLLNR